MSHYASSKILEEIILEFTKKHINIPEKVISDLRSARTLMKVEDADPKQRAETSPKIDEYLGSVEAYLITEAANHFSSEKVDGWLRKLDLASCDSCVISEQPKQAERFVTGVPRDQKWIRVEPLADLPLEKLEELAVECKVGFLEEDNHLVVHGQPEDLKMFIKKLAEKTSRKRL